MMYYECLHNPEPPLEPPEDYYVEADCGCEVYEGQKLYRWGGHTYCEDCVQDELIKCMDAYLEELGCEIKEVERVKK